MGSFVETFAIVVAAANALAGLLGGYRWWQVQSAGPFWAVLRGAQALAAAFAVAAGVAYASGQRPDDDLFWLYVLLPIPVGFVAEQVRAISAQTVLDARGLEDAAAVGKLAPDEQQSVVRAILRREMGVMALSALVVAFLALRAYGTA